MSNQTFTSPRAIDIMDRACAILEDRGRATSADMTTALGLSKNHTVTYLAYMEKLELIHCAERAINVQGGRTQAVWAPGIAPSKGGDTKTARKGFVRQVKVSKKWAPNHVRMAMDCWLFGVPAVLQGVAA